MPNISADDIRIDKNEVLRYLGHRGQAVDENTDKMIDCCMREILKISRCRYVYRIFDVKIELNNNEPCVELTDARLRLTGNDIFRHLKDCRKCAVMAVTLGIEADNGIRIAQGTDMLKAVILDSCATELVEKVCDEVESKIKAEAALRGFDTNFRFSPGYGDLPITTQRDLLNALDAGRKIGLTLTDSSIMIPGKSVSAIIGFTEASLSSGSMSDLTSNNASGCDVCSMRESCEFRRGGTACGRN